MFRTLIRAKVGQVEEDEFIEALEIATQDIKGNNLHLQQKAYFDYVVDVIARCVKVVRMARKYCGNLNHSAEETYGKELWGR